MRALTPCCDIEGEPVNIRHNKSSNRLRTKAETVSRSMREVVLSGGRDTHILQCGRVHINNQNDRNGRLHTYWVFRESALFLR
jgi:hypothetical protein